MEICGIKFAPLNVPLERRLQTLSAFLWFTTILFGGILGCFLAIYLILYTPLRWITLLYLFWIWVIDKDTCERGGRRSTWVRSWRVWKYMKDYFPCKLKKLEGVKLDPNRNYLFCSFPHGLLPAGMCNAFVFEHSGYKTYFPHHVPYTITLSQQFMLPFGREFVLSLGAVSSSSKSIEYLLSRPGGGNVCVLVVGGAKESLYSKPGVYKLALKDRKGFVKLALRNGTPLVPVFSFGEIDLYDQLDGPILRKVQEFLRKWIVIAPVIPIGRGFFQYSFGIIPRRRPVTTIVGEPMEVPKIDKPTKEQIDEYHAKFVEKLTQLFEEQKFNYVEKPENTKLIIE